ncbi:caspase domain-containing protein [Camillea tinctor]|nr:caspase domain-containing protein [Camillea tinctor]
MTSTQSSAATTPPPLVLLIGIDFYEPGAQILNSGGRPFEIKNLTGCVADVTEIEEYLVKVLKVPPECITKLISTTLPSQASAGPTRPVKKASNRPTGKNIRLALNNLLQSPEGTPIYIHYSGHGARSQTVWPEHKGSGDAWDECLVPCDARSGGMVIRDLELGTLLYMMSKKGLLVTIILDCCHSGGATRDDDEDDIIFRGLDEYWTDRKLPPINNSVLDLICPKKESEGNHGQAMNWLNEPGRYELIAACEAHQLAGEKGQHGLLSFELLEALKSAESNLPTHGMLYRRLRGTLLSRRDNQNPVFSGNQMRCFLSSRITKDVSSIQLMTETYGGKPYLYIGAGEQHSVEPGDKYRVYPWYTVDFNDSTYIAMVVVRSTEPTKSLVDIQSNVNSVHPRPGDIAILHERSEKNLVLLRWRSNSPRPDNIIQMAKEFNCAFVSCDQSRPSFQVHIIENNQGFVLRDWDDKPIPNLPTFLRPISLFVGIESFERYSKLKGLSHSECPLVFDFGIDSRPTTTGRITVSPGEVFTFRFENKTKKALYLVVVNLRPLYGIKQVYPGVGAFCGLIEPNSAIPNPPFMKITMRDAPLATEPVVDIFKCIVSTKPLDFGFMQQGNIDGDLGIGHGSRKQVSRGTNPLEDLFRGDVDDEIGLWATKEFETCISRTSN